MKLANVVALDEFGACLCQCTLTAFCKANELGRDFVRELRADAFPTHGRPAPTLIGGGAAPAVYVSLLEPT